MLIFTVYLVLVYRPDYRSSPDSVHMYLIVLHVFRIATSHQLGILSNVLVGKFNKLIYSLFDKIISLFD